jgi:hypothetical protein
METEHAYAKVRLICGEGSVEVDALFDTGTSRSVMSEDLARRLSGCLMRLPEDQRYVLQTEEKGGQVRIEGQVRARVVLPGCEVPSTPFEVSPDLRPGHLIVGRTQLDEWGIAFTDQGPRPKVCPPNLEIL